MTDLTFDKNKDLKGQHRAGLQKTDFMTGATVIPELFVGNM